MIKKMLKAMKGAVLVSFVEGGGFLLARGLELFADSPRSKTARLIAGMPPGLTVYDPSVTFNGTTITLTYQGVF
jgi:hypothetical protein